MEVTINLPQLPTELGHQLWHRWGQKRALLCRNRRVKRTVFISALHFPISNVSPGAHTKSDLSDRGDQLPFIFNVRWRRGATGATGGVSDTISAISVTRCELRELTDAQLYDFMQMSSGATAATANWS